jgi:putative transposase
MQEIRTGRHCVFSLTVHLVFVAKYRRHVFDASALEWLKGHFAKVCEKMGGELLACDGQDDHVHALVSYPPQVSVSQLVGALKGTSSRLLRQERPDIAKRYWKGVLWTPSYFASSTGGATLDKVKKYVEDQRKGALSSPG